MLIAACPTMNAAAYSVAIAEVTTVLMMTLRKQTVHLVHRCQHNLLRIGFHQLMI